MAEAEVEIHADHEHGHHLHGLQGEHAEVTVFARTVAISVSLLGVILAVVTIGSHRAHNAAVLHRSEANDLWGEYQAKRERSYIAQATGNMLPLLPVQDAAKVQQMQALVALYAADRQKYQNEIKDFQQQATAKENESKKEEHRALLLDTSEGFFELGLVLSSLYFLSKRVMFPAIGALAAAVGAYFGVLGFMI